MKNVFFVLGHCAFGIDSDLQNDIDNIYFKKSMATFARDPEKMLMVRLSNLMSFLNPLLIKFMHTTIALIGFLRTSMPSLMGDVQDHPQVWFFKQIEQVVKERLSSGNRRIDLLQLMLDASTQQEIKVRCQLTIERNRYCLSFRITKTRNLHRKNSIMQKY